MMEDPDIAYLVPEEEDAESLWRTVRERFGVRGEQTSRGGVTYFDTFDWRLWAAGSSLRLEATVRGPVLAWRSHDATVRHRLPAETPPPFARDFPEGPFRRELAPLLEMRRLLPVVELTRADRTLAVLDGEAKTVVRLRLEEGSAVAPEAPDRPAPLPAVLRVLPVRGYGRARRRAVRFIESELGLERASGSELERALDAVGRRAGDYTSKVQIELAPAMPAAAAAKRIHRALLAAIRRNEDGARRDLDSEFLHDFRVAVRRTRSALSQIKGVYPERALQPFKRELSWLGGLTGATRDLDVYLLKIEGYKAELPEAVGEDLAPLHDFLRAEQRRAQRRMARSLGTQRYRRLLDSWESFLDEPVAEEGAPPNALRPVGEVASERIWKVYRRAIKRGGKIDEASPADDLHRLRIECKKLRYLMEFFKSLYPQAEIARLIKELKRLQDNLGDFNDYEVQQDHLKRFAEEMHEKGLAPAATLMAMGRLVEHLEKGQARERQRFTERFAGFARKENRRLARELFRGATPEAEA